ncbi:uncharacterized protein BDCG_07556 [Blastomyces dermatitidis ER-3]|uniref:Uncharacterized protein n=1 Tax=Ajellomyces dermatitidis (strain ER-3 / ATCC MYA-2586) TaxID=559297 RepID=A0ABP2F5S9_AJEDR|nr:uncharacterized protein BDCG_07556 [Blastomyces dermatitidis ER-3]EEQ92436.2 hypothetical protein BDCG_07556 [Blastomyces dermatitidis ER-3]
MSWQQLQGESNATPSGAPRKLVLNRKEIGDGRGFSRKPRAFVQISMVRNGGCRMTDDIIEIYVTK